MTLRLIGAGFPRTGTKSLQLALEQLLGGRCYHMHEVFANLDHVPIWRRALRGDPPDWNRFLANYVATVDWPASAFWRELGDANPEAIVVLTQRDDASTWWRSADRTILEVARLDAFPKYGDWLELFHELLRERIGERWDDASTAMTAYERHNEDVRNAIAPGRLVEWRPEDGWAPICRALEVAVPPAPFPHVNTTAEWAQQSEEAEVK
ncbi:MAG: sulfotransferase family protein [Actinobacteria bacterium]|nr:sulfotransferase family protein [Actinomycetota bacterium]